MNNMQLILDKIRLLRRTLTELHTAVVSLEGGRTKAKTRQGALPDEKQLKAEYEDLYRHFLEAQTDVVGEFVTAKKKPYLMVFFRVNNLPIDLKRVSKEAAAQQLRNWLSQRKAITAPVIHRE
jgi:hypothetical protein